MQSQNPVECDWHYQNHTSSARSKSHSQVAETRLVDDSLLQAASLTFERRDVELHIQMGLIYCVDVVKATFTLRIV